MIPRCSLCRRAANPLESDLVRFGDGWWCSPVVWRRVSCLEQAMRQDEAQALPVRAVL